MGKISNVLYKEMDPHVCSPKDSAELFFYMNLLDVSDQIREDYMQYEENQIRIRNQAIHTEIEAGLPMKPNVQSTIFGASSVKNRTILVTELQ